MTDSRYLMASQSFEQQAWFDAVWGLWPRYQRLLSWSCRSRVRAPARRLILALMSTHAHIRYARSMARSA
jgi:hypothetical protein